MPTCIMECFFGGVKPGRLGGRRSVVPFDVYSVKATHVDLDALGRAKFRVRRMPTTFYLQINCLFEDCSYERRGERLTPNLTL